MLSKTELNLESGDTIHQAAQTSWLDPQLRLEF